jgi:predicted transcriptional regulator of viral defense system
MAIQRDIVYSLLEQRKIVKTEELSSAGVHRETIHRMVEAGDIIKLARGLYSLPDYQPTENYSLFEAQKLVAKGVVCLLSALSYHGIGTQNPSEIWMAIPRKTRPPKIDSSPVKIVKFSGEGYRNGIEKHIIENNEIKIYNIPKTIADCFKYRNKLGMDVAIEALKDVMLNKQATVDEIIKYSEICRVRKIITPYMESLA